MRKNFNELPLPERLINKILAFYSNIWKDKLEENFHLDWINNFINDDKELEEKERINMLFLLSKFMYFGNKELRLLLISLYRDLYKYPLVSEIRRKNQDTIDIELINSEFNKVLKKTKFLGVGNPSESGVHLLYYFRQECKLNKKYFINSGEIFVH